MNKCSAFMFPNIPSSTYEIMYTYPRETVSPWDRLAG